MERSITKTKLSRRAEREIKRISRSDEYPAVVSIPEVVRVVIVAVQPPLVIVVIDFEHLQVAVRIGTV